MNRIRHEERVHLYHDDRGLVPEHRLVGIGPNNEPEAWGAWVPCETIAELKVRTPVKSDQVEFLMRHGFLRSKLNGVALEPVEQLAEHFMYLPTHHGSQGDHWEVVRVKRCQPVGEDEYLVADERGYVSPGKDPLWLVPTPQPKHAGAKQWMGNERGREPHRPPRITEIEIPD